MRSFLPLAAIAFVGAAAPPPTLPVHVGGRIIPATDGFVFGWPGIYVEGRFEGPAVRVRVDSGTEHLSVAVDGEPRAWLTKPGTADVTIGELPPGPHVVRLEKLTESQQGGARFRGFSLPQGGRALPPQPRARRIEFIGDSYTVGYGNRSPKRECTRTEIHDLTDTQVAFGPLAAKRMATDYRVNAYSGFGVVRNYNGSSATLSLPAIYPRLKPDTPTVATTAADGWAPQLIVINLGTNDFSTPLKEGERWKSDAGLRADYRRRYHEFVSGLHKEHPRAKFLLMGSERFIDDVRQVASLLRLSPGMTVKAVEFGGLDLMGCDWHPSLADHRKLADLVEKEAIALQPW